MPLTNQFISMKFFILLYFRTGLAALLVVSAITGFAQTLIPKEDAGDWGYVDGTGKWVIEPQFYKAFPFSTDSFDHKYAIALTTQKKGKKILGHRYKIIDKNGDIVLDEYPIKQNYETGQRYVSREQYASYGQPGFIFDLKTGRYIVLPNSVHVLQGSEYPGKKYFFTILGYGSKSKDGIVRADSLTSVLDIVYDDIKFYPGKNYVTLLKDGKYAILDSNLKTLIDFKYKSVEFQKDDKSIKVVLDKNQLLVDFHDHVLKEITYEKRLNEDGGTGLYPAITNGKWGYVNAADEWVIPAQFLKVRPFSSDGITMVQLADGKSTLINKKGELIGKYRYDNFDYYYQKSAIMVPMKVNNLWGYFDMHTESVIIAPAFEDASTFDVKGIAIVKTKDRWGCINKTGEFVIPAIYVSFGEFDENGWAIVNNGIGPNSYGLITRNGKSAIEGYQQICRYQNVEYNGYNHYKSIKTSYGTINVSGYYTVTLDGQYYGVSPNGK